MNLVDINQKTSDSTNTPEGGAPLSRAVAYETLKDSMGRNRTLSLFVEHKHDSYPAPYTLKTYDHKGAMSMYRLYMEIGDPTEYQQAVQLLGSWEHWQQLVAGKWFAEYIDKWRKELKVKMESDRYCEMIDTAEQHKGTPTGIQASKWLADRYGEKAPSKRGRPSKDEKKQALREVTEEHKLITEEQERLGL